MLTIDMLPAPLPRIPSPAQPDKIPTPDELEPLHPPAAQVVRDMLQVITEAAIALREVQDARYGGPAWNAAALEDQRALIAGKPLGALEGLMRDEPLRYARASALVGTSLSRWDACRVAGQKDLTQAATIATARADELRDGLAALVREAWPLRGTGKGVLAAEQAVALVGQIERLRAIAAWCDGTDRIIDRSGAKPIGLEPKDAGLYIAVESHLTGRHRLIPPAGVIMPGDYVRAEQSTGQVVVVGSR